MRNTGEISNRNHIYRWVNLNPKSEQSLSVPGLSRILSSWGKRGNISRFLLFLIRSLCPAGGSEHVIIDRKFWIKIGHSQHNDTNIDLHNEESVLSNFEKKIPSIVRPLFNLSFDMCFVISNPSFIKAECFFRTYSFVV